MATTRSRDATLEPYVDQRGGAYFLGPWEARFCWTNEVVTWAHVIYAAETEGRHTVGTGHDLMVGPVKLKMDDLTRISTWDDAEDRFPEWSREHRFSKTRHAADKFTWFRSGKDILQFYAKHLFMP